MISERTKTFVGVGILGIVFIVGWRLINGPTTPAQEQQPVAQIVQAPDTAPERDYSPAERVALGKLAQASEAFMKRDIETTLPLAAEVAADKSIGNDLRSTGLTLTAICLTIKNQLDPAEAMFKEVLTLKGADPRDVMTAKNGLKIIERIRHVQDMNKHKPGSTEV